MKITALTYNFIGIPFFSKRYSRRLDFFTKELAKLQPDVICLQEVWLNSAKKKIINVLKDLDYQFYYPSLKFRLCGLLIGVKGKITKKGYVATNPIIAGFDYSILEIFGSKGYAFVEFELGKEKIGIFDVHLSPDLGIKFNIGGPYFKVQEKATSFLVRDINLLGEGRVMILGDFNFEQSSPLNQYLIETGKVREVFSHNFKTSFGGLLGFPSSATDEPDHIFVKNISRKEILKTEIVWDKPIEGVGVLSDHAGILVTMNLDNFKKKTSLSSKGFLWVRG